MIDIKKAEIAFNEYVKPYDITNGKIELKIKHTYRTVEVAKNIATDLNLNKEQMEKARFRKMVPAAPT